MDMIESRIRDSIEVKEKILADKHLITEIENISNCIIQALEKGGRVFLCGNGGSASDALHIAGELLGKFQRERKAIPAIVLNADIATMTSIANDYGYENIFARQVEGLLTENDVLLGISTSGNSENIYKALLKVRDIGGQTIALLGKDGGKIKGIVDYKIIVPSDCTARIQESHIMIGHILCELVENRL